MIKIAFLLLPLFIVSAGKSNADSLSLPSWVHTPPAETAEHKYYVGFSDDELKESSALAKAYSNASEKAIRENFGTMVQLRESGSISLSNNGYTKTLSEKSYVAKIKGFEQVSSWSIQQSNQKFSAGLLFRYSKKEIQEEKKRQSKLNQKDLNELVSSGEEGILYGGLKIDTYPRGAKVLIDDEPYAVTPLSISGQLSAGFHNITIDHPEHELLRFKVEIKPGEITDIHETLEPTVGSIEILSDPSDADLVINGQPMGKTPVRIEARAGKKIEILLKHPLTFPLTISGITITRNKQKEKFLLVLKKTKVSIETDVPNCKIYLGDKYIGKSPLSRDLPIGTYELTIFKPNGNKITKQIKLDHGVERNLFYHITNY